MGIISDIIHGTLDQKKIERYRKKLNSRAYIYGDFKYTPPESAAKKKKRRLIKPALDDAINVFRSLIIGNIKFIEGLDDNADLPWVKGKLIERGGTRYVAVPTHVVRKAYESKGFSYGDGVNVLKEKGLLLTAEDGRHNAVRLRLNGTLEWCLAVKADILQLVPPDR
jgi:hypothetical protein